MFAASSAGASPITYDVNLNFDPTVQGGGPGVGTVTGTVTIDTASNTVTAVNLTESTNNGLSNIGGGFGSPTTAALLSIRSEPSTLFFLDKRRQIRLMR
jgi:hypothetical protein